jgi:hypothetical protein
MGDGLENRFIDHLQVETTSNYSAVINLDISQITTVPIKPFSSLLCLQLLFPSNGF